MRVFKTKWFMRWAYKEGLADVALWNAVDEMNRGLVDANLGGCVYKKRVGTSGRGKSGGLRTLLASRIGDRAFFMFGFAKNERANIDDKQLQALKLLGSHLLSYDHKSLMRAQQDGELYEVRGNE